MSSIPNAVIPHAIERAPQEPAKSGRASAKLVKLALVPPLVALGLGAFAFTALRSLASELARKIDANAGSASTEATPRKTHQAFLSEEWKLVTPTGIEPVFQP